MTTSWTYEYAFAIPAPAGRIFEASDAMIR